MGILFSLVSQSFPPASKYSLNDIPDLDGKIIIVTGGNSGIGKETVKALLEHNAKVYIAARNKTKTEEAIEDLRQQTGKQAVFLQLDLADMKAVKAAAEEFLSKETELHVLYNNGGVMATPADQLTADGYDMQFGTNVLGHFYFTKLLLPILTSTAKASPDNKSRVVNISSLSHIFGGLDFNTFVDGPARRRQSPEQQYGQSKLGNMVFTAELARRYGTEGIVSTAVNPGNINTDIIRNMTGIRALFLKLIFYDVSYGALTQLWAGTSPEGADFNGKYAIPWARIGVPSSASQNPDTGMQLWRWLEEQVEKFETKNSDP